MYGFDKDCSGVLKMIRKGLLLIALIGIVFSLFGCHTAKGVKEDAQFIGDKTLEFVEKE
jgi:predicted small secreted protein